MSAALKTTEMILSFPSLTVPRSVAGGAPKFQATLVEIPGVTDVNALKAAFVEAGTEFFGEAAFRKHLTSSKFKRALKKTDDDEADVERYGEGRVFISCYSPEGNKPEVVDRYADPATGKPRVLTDAEIAKKCYPGSHGRAVVRFYGYDHGGNKGIACAINAYQWLADGPRLDSRVSAEDAFEAEEMDTADLPDPVEEEVEEAPKKAAKKAAPKAAKAKDDGDLSDLL